MKFEVAIQALSRAAWEWSEQGFASVAASLGLEREPDAAADTPSYTSPWGKEWVQAIVADGAVDRVEFLVEDTSPRWRPFTTRKLEALARKYRDKLGVYVTRASGVLGEPVFFGEEGAPGFPDDEGGHQLALWKLDTARVMLMARNEGPDTPFWISIVIKPPAARAPTARPSAPALYVPRSRASSTALVGAQFDAAIDAIRATRWDWSARALAAIAESLPLPANVAGTRVELTIESLAANGQGYSPEYREDLDGAFCAKFESYVHRATQVLGRPTFNDGFAASDWPDDEAGSFLALWLLPDVRVMIKYRNDGASSPFTLSLIVKPG